MPPNKPVLKIELPIRDPVIPHKEATAYPTATHDNEVHYVRDPSKPYPSQNCYIPDHSRLVRGHFDEVPGDTSDRKKSLNNWSTRWTDWAYVCPKIEIMEASSVEHVEDVASANEMGWVEDQGEEGRGERELERLKACVKSVSDHDRDWGRFLKPDIPGLGRLRKSARYPKKRRASFGGEDEAGGYEERTKRILENIEPLGDEGEEDLVQDPELVRRMTWCGLSGEETGDMEVAPGISGFHGS